MYPGIMPILHSPGVITPGQLGPIKRDLQPFCIRRDFTIAISFTGMPSVIVIIRGISASIASRIESAANAGGTNIAQAFAPSFSTDSLMVLNTGTFWSKSIPPLPGVTPATIFEPYSMHWRVWKEPVLPVMPLITTLVSLLTSMLIFVEI